MKNERKTKVITFRLKNEESCQLDDIQTQTGLSYGALMKLGMGIAQEEIKTKLTEAVGLKNKLSQLEAEVRQAKQQLNKTLNEERNRKLAKLDTEMEAFKLFDQGWTLETVSFRMGIPHETVYLYFQKWGDERNNKQAKEWELLRECLRKHLDVLKDRYHWCSLFPSTPEERLKEIQEQINCCQYLLQAPSEIDEVWKAFLLAEYSRKISPGQKRSLTETSDATSLE